MKKLILLTLLVAPLFAQASIRENGGRMAAAAAAQIEFFSPGDGIDRNLKKAVDALIQEYKDAGLVVAHKEKIVGREGETLVCVQIDGLNSSIQFNTELEALVKKGQRKTNITYVANCDEKK